ncbi:MAG TPA: biotin/lipoyl-binding protein [Sulfurimonas sp.]|nr:biotin/lipoyl-binding protein [Sulfurimonas sp.]HIM74709.1 biotin/lipoyl-binding protein [Campylobacterales bacterium]
MNILKTILASALITSLTLFSACSEEKKTPIKKERPALVVNTVTVKNEPVPIWKQYTGMTKASSDQDVRVRVSGILEKIYFHDGQEVKKGQKLFKIQQAEYIAVLNIAKAKKHQDEASLALAKADVARYEPLVQEGLAPRATLERYQAQKDGLSAAIPQKMEDIIVVPTEFDPDRMLRLFNIGYNFGITETDWKTSIDFEEYDKHQ